MLKEERIFRIPKKVVSQRIADKVERLAKNVRFVGAGADRALNGAGELVLRRERTDEDNGDEQEIPRLCPFGLIAVERAYCHETEQNKSGNRRAHDEIDAATHSDKGNEQKGSERHPIKSALWSCTVDDDEIDEKFKKHK